MDKIKCSYCEKNEATIVMEKFCISHRIKNNHLIQKDEIDRKTYWCDKCWHEYD